MTWMQNNYDKQMQPSKELLVPGGGNGESFPSLSSINNLRCLFRIPAGVVSPLERHIPRFQMATLRRTGEIELQLKEACTGANSKNIEIGLKRCTQHVHTFSYSDTRLSRSIDPLSCTFHYVE